MIKDRSFGPIAGALFALLVAGCLAGCWVIDTDIPAITEVNRPEGPVIAPGEYCHADPDELALEECFELVWVEEDRRYQVIADVDEAPAALDMAQLTRGFALIQMVEADANEGEPDYWLVRARYAPGLGFVVTPPKFGDVDADSIALNRWVQIDPEGSGHGAIRNGYPTTIVAYLSDLTTAELDAVLREEGGLQSLMNRSIYYVRRDGLDPEMAEDAALSHALESLRAALQFSATLE